MVQETKMLCMFIYIVKIIFNDILTGDVEIIQRLHREITYSKVKYTLPFVLFHCNFDIVSTSRVFKMFSELKFICYCV
jgi:hypothetical protein